jgi:hypothetical protein
MSEFLMQCPLTKHVHQLDGWINNFHIQIMDEILKHLPHGRKVWIFVFKMTPYGKFGLVLKPSNPKP